MDQRRPTNGEIGADDTGESVAEAPSTLESLQGEAARRRSMLIVVWGAPDTLERAIAHAGAAASEGHAASVIGDGLRLAHRQVLERLASVGVRAMESVGQTFDPRVHEAVDAGP